MSFIKAAFEHGGVFMYFILVFGLMTIAFIAERVSALYFKWKDVPADFRSTLVDHIRRQDLEGGERYAAKFSKDAALARVAELAFALRAAQAGDEEVQARMDEKLNAEIALVDRRTGFLAMFGNVATLVGLLGTIGGMIVAFAGVADANPADRATMLSKGISHALNCTGFGLLVAIPALVFFAVLQNRTDQVIKSLVSGTTEIYHDLLFLTEPAAVSAGSTIRGRKASEEIRA